MKSILRLNKNMQCGISYPSVVSGQTSDDWATLLAPVPRDTLPRLLLAGEDLQEHGRVLADGDTVDEITKESTKFHRTHL